MIVSMTGFGDAVAERDGAHYAVEIRSVNNRFYKPVIKLPDNLSGLEPEIDTLLRERLGRGSVNYTLKMRVESAEAAYHINRPVLNAYIEQLKGIAGLDGIARIDLAGLLALPGVCTEPRDDVVEIERHGPTIREASLRAIDKLNVMRAREGQSLYADLTKHTRVIATNLATIEKRAPFVVDEYHKRLSTRVAELMSKAQLRVNEVDLIKEVAIFAERADISEEIHRLTHHIDQFDKACQSDEHAGRKLDFIAQEMLREANTIGSKANDAAIAVAIVEIKGAIDRLKEQVQNVE